jgi:hypothetical protein
MAEISVLCKKTLCFFHPDVNTSEAVQQAMNTRRHNEPLANTFTIKADRFMAQSAPDWIVNTTLWDMVAKDGDIFVVPTPPAKVAVTVDNVDVDTKAKIEQVIRGTSAQINYTPGANGAGETLNIANLDPVVEEKVETVVSGSQAKVTKKAK